MTGAPLVLPAEASFVLLTARRTLNFVERAAKAGEEYHDLQPPVDLQCGYAVKMRFEKREDGSLRPVVRVDAASVHHSVQYSAEGRLQVATAILGGPTTEIAPSGSRRFCLTKDK